MANFTEKAILETFEQMLSQTPLDKITVTGLAKTCGISPNTFYYHFEDLYDLLNRWMTSKANVIMAACGDMPDWGEKFKFILHDFKAHSRLVYNIADSLSREQLERFIFVQAEDFFVRIIKSRAGGDIPESSVRKIAEFYCYAVLGFILRFIWQRMTADIDREVDSLYQIFRGSMNKLL
jgi:AcrR family transcriptional regulator